MLELGFESGRMKTGTPPRVDGRSLDFSKMIIQPGDDHPEKFSYSDITKPLTEQRPCHMSHTSALVHDLLREGFDRSPMFNGRIKSTGPRYCPSIEDKINRFADKDSHQLFVEPEGWNTCEYYINGFSTSLPEDVQFKALRSVVGFEKWINWKISARREQYELILSKRLYNKSLKKDQFELPASAVTKVLIKALEDKVPRSKYMITTPTRVAALLKRLLPNKWLDNFMAQR